MKQSARVHWEAGRCRLGSQGSCRLSSGLMSSLTRLLPFSRRQAGRTIHRRIVASFARTIQVIDPASGTQTTITPGQIGTFTEPEWMPGTSALVFGSNQAGSWDIYSVNVDQPEPVPSGKAQLSIPLGQGDGSSALRAPGNGEYTQHSYFHASGPVPRKGRSSCNVR